MPNGQPFVVEEVAAWIADRDAVAELLLDYSVYLHEQTAVLKRAVAEGRGSEAHRIAHAIRGGALTVQAFPLADAAHNIEKVTNSKNSAPAGALLSELESKVEAWIAALRTAKITKRL